MGKFRLLSIPAALALTIAVSAAVPGSQHSKDASQSTPGPVGDFNGDCFADLAVGAPLEDTPGDSGVVNVIYGSPSGLTAAGNQVWSQNSAGIVDSREVEDNF